MPSDSHLMDETTPLGSLLNPLLMPPPTEQKELSRSAQAVLDCLELHRAGQRPPQSWWQHRLTPHDYGEVLRVLDGGTSLRGYVEDKVRLDYDPYRSLITIRIPTPLHDIFCARLVSEVSAQLGKFQKSNKPFADFARKVDHKSTTRIWLPNETTNGEQTRSERSPDASFKHEQAKYPGVIIEVCYTQKARAAADLADDYILDTNGNVKAVIALNIEYRGSKKATISIWRPEDITIDGVEELQAIAKVDALPF
ncbi:unnamed protein product [Penicillium olsonii]|uniref:Uncharacterized protein n=1 Tax=Penicillium olsonii TaxID=99116 RepID=A0A9W4MLW9_PENOL|nr:unnamed protein product [Penicillium olsonii]CAG8266448.1 unnamed protein product [Penicillium olsonii]